MNLLVVISLLILIVAEAHHTPEHTLRGPRFATGKVHIYDVEFNVTSGVKGLSSQVSKSAFQAELQVYAKTEKEHLLKITKVYTSGSVAAAANVDGYVPMQKNRDLEDKLASPIKFTLENGKVTSYTLSSSESLESKKIKKGILRSLEMHIPESVLKQMDSSSPGLRAPPVIYNTTKNLGMGQHSTHYLITVSTNVEFPYESSVYNVSRSENFEGERYYSHQFHHNFRSQGCSNVCKTDRSNNKYGAGCPVGYEPYQTPMKTYLHHQHNLALESNIMTPEIIRTVEVHTAKMYDQDMEILIRQNLRKIGYSAKTIEEPTGQTTYTDLNDQESEIDEKEIQNQCNYGNPREAAETAKTLLNEISQILVSGDLKNRQSTNVGEKIILLKSALSKLKIEDLKQVGANIVRIGSLKNAKPEEKVKRQIWMDILPLIGKPEAVTFTITYIRENLDKDSIFTWEAKEILEALPQNIHEPTERVVSELRSLLTLPKVSENHLLHSAAYACLARVIGYMCNGTESVSSQRVQRSRYERSPDYLSRLEQNVKNSFVSPVECPVALVTDIIRDITEKLRTSRKPDDIIVYIEALTRTGVSDALPVVSEYAYGTAQNLQDFSPSYIEFVKSAALYALHKVVGRHPEEVLKIAIPVYFNQTETPKIRTAAFGILIRAEPSLEILQHVAVHSWVEKSNEVGSFVTSSLDTYGNASQPCMLLTAHRIKQVMPMLKRFDIGLQHSKNLLWSYFDENRHFGIRNNLVYTPNNASIVPSGIYYALAYSADSLSDSILESAVNVQGLTQQMIFKYIDDQILGISTVEAIPPSKEKKIFEEAKIVDRIPEALRFTIYRRMFYSSSFYYLDLNNLKPQIDTLKEYLTAYLRKTSYDYSGHLVKVFLPSSFHTKTVAKSLPYPVEFQMHQPVVLALEIESRERNPTLPNFHFLIRPSVYLTKLFTNQLHNVGDCKEVGVYHEHKIAISYPIEVKLQVKGNITVSYKLPELPRKVLHYSTEAGTYAGKKTVDALPSSGDRKPIRTLPAPFKNATTISLVGFPPIHVETHTEDIGLWSETLPSTPLEVIDYAVKKVLNAGWRYKAANISIEDNSREWPKGTEVTFNINYDRSHVTKGKQKMSKQDSNPWSENQGIFRSGEFMSEEEESLSTEASQQWPWGKKTSEENDWSNDLKPDDIPNTKSPSTFAEQARRISSKLSSLIPHIKHILDIGIETRPVHNAANIRVEYNHTHDKSLHSVHIDATVKTQSERTTRKISIDHLMGFIGKPDEFQYESHKDDHKALFITALRSHPLSCTCPWKDVEVVAKGVFQYEPLDNLLNNELESPVDPKYFSSQHDQCVEDTKNGFSQSEGCLRASSDRSIYNKLRMSILWNRELPKSVRNLARRADIFMKHIFYNHMSVDYDSNTANKIAIDLSHIDKLSDKPVFDVTIRKPEESVTLRRVKSFGLALSSIHDLFTSDLMELTNNTYPPTCVMMERSIRTYDLKYYPLSLDKCNYVLSTHCTEYKNFAIIAKILSTDGTKEIHVHVGPHTLIMSPKSGNHYSVKYDDQDYNVSEPLVFDEDTAEIYVFSEMYSPNHSHLEVVAGRVGIRVIYDGKNVKVQVDPKYKGETCGLCSEFDGERIREFRGLDKCLYSHPADFVNSAITNRRTCRKVPLHPFICEQDTNMEWGGRSTVGDNEPSIKRNIIRSRDNELCFSVLSVPVCEGDAKPTETEPRQVGFHCLPKQDITAKRMISEAKRRSLGEIENKKVDFEEEVQVAKMC